MTAEELQWALADISAEKDPSPTSEDPVPTIRKGRPLSWEDWLKGRRARREAGDRVAPTVIRRDASSSDPRLRELFKGERGLPFRRTEDLPP